MVSLISVMTKLCAPSCMLRMMQASLLGIHSLRTCGWDEPGSWKIQYGQKCVIHHCDTYDKIKVTMDCRWSEVVKDFPCIRNATLVPQTMDEIATTTLFLFQMAMLMTPMSM